MIDTLIVKILNESVSHEVTSLLESCDEVTKFLESKNKLNEEEAYLLEDLYALQEKYNMVVHRLRRYDSKTVNFRGNKLENLFEQSQRTNYFKQL